MATKQRTSAGTHVVLCADREGESYNTTSLAHLLGGQHLQYLERYRQEGLPRDIRDSFQSREVTVALLDQLDKPKSFGKLLDIPGHVVHFADTDALWHKFLAVTGKIQPIAPAKFIAACRGNDNWMRTRQPRARPVVATWKDDWNDSAAELVAALLNAQGMETIADWMEGDDVASAVQRVCEWIHAGRSAIVRCKGTGFADYMLKGMVAAHKIEYIEIPDLDELLDNVWQKAVDRAMRRKIVEAMMH